MKEGSLRLQAIAVFVISLSGCALLDEVRGPRVVHLDEAAVRAFAADEQSAWNAHDFDRYYSLCAPGAVFVSVRWNPDGSITHVSRSPEQDRANAEQFFHDHPGKFTETDDIDRIVIAPDGQSARILGHSTATIAGERAVLRATTEQIVVIRGGRVFSLGQTDTAVR